MTRKPARSVFCLAPVCLLTLLALPACTRTVTITNTGMQELAIRGAETPNGPWNQNLGEGESVTLKIKAGEELQLQGVRLQID